MTHSARGVLRHAHMCVHTHTREKAAEALMPRLKAMEEEERLAGLSLAGQIVRHAWRAEGEDCWRCGLQAHAQGLVWV